MVYDEDTDAVVVRDLLKRGQILVVLRIGIDLRGNVVSYHLKSINEEQSRGGVVLQYVLDLAFQFGTELTAGEAEMQVVGRSIRQVLHTLLDAPFAVLQCEIHDVRLSCWETPYRLSFADLKAHPQHHPALADF